MSLEIIESVVFTCLITAGLGCFMCVFCLAITIWIMPGEYGCPPSQMYLRLTPYLKRVSDIGAQITLISVVTGCVKAFLMIPFVFYTK